MLFVLVLAMLSLAAAAPTSSLYNNNDNNNNNTTTTTELTTTNLNLNAQAAAARGVVLCSLPNGRGDCTFSPLQSGACLPLPCEGKESSCQTGFSMDGAWKTFFLNAGTVCYLHASRECRSNFLRADPILFPGTVDLETWGRAPERGWHGAQVTYLAYACYAAGA